MPGIKRSDQLRAGNRTLEPANLKGPVCSMGNSRCAVMLLLSVVVLGAQVVCGVGGGDVGGVRVGRGVVVLGVLVVLVKVLVVLFVVVL